MASILTEMVDQDEAGADDSSSMLDEVLKWLDRQRLKRRSEELMKKITEAEKIQNIEGVKALLLEKMKVDMDLKND